MATKILHKSLLMLSLVSAMAVPILSVLGYRTGIGPSVVLCFVSLALYCMGHSFLKQFAFTVWVFAFVSVSMFHPAAFGSWFGFDLKTLIVPLIQVIMFGMGTTLSLRDFRRIFAMPWPIFVGTLSQFIIMPFTSFAIATLFGFEPEIAAGVVLIGSVPGGVASNVMCYLARGNVALSVTMTACTTLVSPFMTPLMMKLLAGKLVPIHFVSMMLSIVDMIVVPVFAGLIANRILYSASRWANRMGPLSAMAIGSLLLAVGTVLFGNRLPGVLISMRNGIVIGAALIGVVAMAKWIISLVLKKPSGWIDKALPIFSMAGICAIIAIITAQSSEKLLTVGLRLFAAAVFLNATGYLLGYWFARVGRLDESSCRAVAFEVGMQNGGMASGLAMNVLKSPFTALAPAIFGPWQNISGSILANWWHRRDIPTRKEGGSNESP